MTHKTNILFSLIEFDKLCRFDHQRISARFSNNRWAEGMELPPELDSMELKLHSSYPLQELQYYGVGNPFGTPSKKRGKIPQPTSNEAWFVSPKNGVPHPIEPIHWLPEQEHTHTLSHCLCKEQNAKSKCNEPGKSEKVINLIAQSSTTDGPQSGRLSSSGWTVLPTYEQATHTQRWPTTSVDFPARINLVPAHCRWQVFDTIPAS